MELPSSFLLGAIITILLILASFIVGYHIINEIGSFYGYKKGVDLYQEISKLVNYMYYQTEGSSKIVTIPLTPNDEILCLINYEDVESYAESANYLRDYDRKYLKEIIPEENLKRDIPINMYYHRRNHQPQVYSIKYLRPEHTFCLNKTSELYFENKGYYITVMPVIEK